MSHYCIKDEYIHGTINKTLEQSVGQYWSPSRFRATRYNQYATYQCAEQLARQHQLKSVLDVGCGIGYKLVHVIAPVAQKVLGVDQPNAVNYAQRFYPNYQFESLDLEQPDQPHFGQFDLIISADVIEHLLNPDVLLKFIYSHCHANSYVVISTPERDVRRGTDNIKSPHNEHVREWNRVELKRYLESKRFTVIHQELLPGFRVGWSPKMMRERFRLIRKNIPYCYNQVAVCRPTGIA